MIAKTRALVLLGFAFTIACGDDDGGVDAAGVDAAGFDGGGVDSGADSGVDSGVGTDTGPGPDANLPTELKAFPTAYGAGAYVTGGRGGVVVPVTRLDDARDGDGDPTEGTLRYALTRDFPRTIVFRVSGTIIVGDTDGDGEIDSDHRFPGMISLEDENLGNFTVAGQTAPEGGINVRGHLYTDGVRNMIWRYVRFRKNTEAEFDTIDINNTQDVILDHVSASFGSDECVTVAHSDGRPMQTGITVQYGLFGESKTGSIMTITEGGALSFHNNFYTQITHRFPNVSGEGRFDIVNNLVHNWGFRLVNVHGTLEVNHINNAAVGGARTELAGNYQVISNKVHLGTEGILDSRIFTEGNFITDVVESTDDGWPSWTAFVDGHGYSAGDVAPPELQASAAFDMIAPAAPLRTAAQIIADLPDEVGAFRTLDENGDVVVFRDAVDAEFIANYRSGSAPNYTFDEEAVTAGRPHFEYPTVPNNEPYADRDGDGMPDAWEMAHGFDPDVADDSGDADDDGYTNLEEFLNEVDAD